MEASSPIVALVVLSFLRSYNCEVPSLNSNICCADKTKCHHNPELSLTNLNNTIYSENVTNLTKALYSNFAWHSAVFFPNSTEDEMIQLSCSASFPIEIEIDSKMPARVLDLQMERTLVNYSDTSTYCFHIKLNLVLHYSITGNYICQEIVPPENEVSKASSIYLFVNDGKNATLLNSGLGMNYTTKSDGNPNNDGLIEIPCISTNPYTEPELLKGSADFQTTTAMKNQDFLRYAPSRGFLVLANNTVLKGFSCKLGNTMLRIRFESPAVTTAEAAIPAHFRVSPNNRGTNYNSKSNVTILINLSCGSNKPVTFKTTLQDSGLKFDIKHVETSTYYRYKATGQLSGTIRKTFSVTCVVNNSQQVLHTWKFDLFAESRPGIYYDGDKHFRCISSERETPSIALITCANQINCETARKFVSLIQTKPEFYPFNVSKGYACSNKWTLPGEKKDCAIIPAVVGHRDGVVLCQEESSDVNKEDEFTQLHYLNYYTGFGDNIITVLNANTIPQILQLHSLELTLYVDELVTFTCEASAFIFSQGLKFFIHDGLKTMAEDYDENLSKVESIKDGKIKSQVTIKLSTNMTKIECAAPLWNTITWQRVFQAVEVKDGKCVELDSTIETFTFSPLEKNKSLHCEATGIPKPVITWEKDGQMLPNITGFEVVQKLFSDDDEKSASTIHFTEIKDYHNGVYICIAISRKSSAQKQFNVVVKPNEEIGSLIIGLIVGIFALFVLLIACVAFYFVRKHKEALVEKLSELEIEEFVHGNEELIQKFTDLHDNARYLPYKQDFEIPKHKLEIKTDELLGSGVSGFVYKGYLTKQERRIPVAVKTVRTSEVATLKILLSEIKILMYIGVHTNVINLLGAMTNELREGKLHSVVEFCGFGSIQSFLRDHRATFLDQIVDDEINKSAKCKRSSSSGPIDRLKLISWKLDDFTLESGDGNDTSRRISARGSIVIKTNDLVKWSFQVASGMEYLGLKKVIHGDLAARNLLLNEDLVVKITDFGLSRHLYDYTNYIKKQKDDLLPWRWLAVEAIGDLRFSIETDIWAYAVTLWEIYALGESPYQGFSWGEEFVQRLSNGYRLPQPKYATSAIHAMMQECWLKKPSRRPTFTTLKNFFQNLVEKYSDQ